MPSGRKYLSGASSARSKPRPVTRGIRGAAKPNLPQSKPRTKSRMSPSPTRASNGNFDLGKSIEQVGATLNKIIPTRPGPNIPDAAQSKRNNDAIRKSLGQ